MAQSSDPGHFFQTTSALEESARKAAKSKNTKGNPIKLPSKILAVAADPSDAECLYVAEAAGTVKRISLETNSVVATFTGPTAPLTSLAVSPSTSTLYAGCWDKSIWSWDTATRKPGRRFTGGHADFVKTLLLVTLPGQQKNELLISGSADATIILWNPSTGEKLHTLKGHSRAILSLAVDPESYDDEDEVSGGNAGGSGEGVTLFSASSDRTIRRWNISTSSAAEIPNSDPIIAHETSVDAIHFDASGDLWTASADKTAKCLSRSRNWEADTTLEHADYVRDVAIDEVGGWVITACRDEGVRVWERGSGRLKHVFEGHWEEVTGLCVVGGQRVVSVSIDGTVRVWGLKAAELEKAIKEAQEEKDGVEKDAEVKESLLTEEEERELAELLGDSD